MNRHSTLAIVACSLIAGTVVLVITGHPRWAVALFLVLVTLQVHERN
jgi:hypothetical protein